MATLTTPGIYLKPLQPLQPIRVAGDLLRSDIAAFIGYARKGPARIPVQLESWQTFLAIFGLPEGEGHLALAVKAFFENGGTTCYVYRLVDEQVATSNLVLLNCAGVPTWRMLASFRLSDVTAETEEGDRPDPAIVRNVKPGETRVPVCNPGVWGNSLAVTMQRSSRLSTVINGTDIFNNGFSTWVSSLVGLEENSIVELSQEGVTPARIVAIESIDRFRQSITWSESLLETFNIDLPIRLDTVEVDVIVEYEKRQVETFMWLGIHPAHSRSLFTVLAQQSKYINIEPLATNDFDWNDSNNWPASVTHASLTGGLDGVSTISAQHYLRALKNLATVDDISIVAAPDLVLRAEEGRKPVSQAIPQKIDCRALLAPLKGLIFGIVTNGTVPVTGVAITDAGTGQRVISDGHGHFLLRNLDISLRTLRFEKAGFSQEERQVFSAATQSAQPDVFSIEPLAIPRNLGDAEILEVQQAMSNPFILGRYRIALLDPPAPALRVDQIRAWRSQIGDTAICGLFYPWLETAGTLPLESRLYPVPPCGHVAGLLARMDREQGPHRTPANIRLRFAKRVLRTVNETEHGIVNAEGINVIRSLPGQGIRIMGARTLSSDAQWRYLNVRRLMFALEKTLERALQWSVFETNTTVLRQALTLSVNTLLNIVWRRGGLAGKSPDAAYRVKCDSDNNPAAQRDQGKLLIEIAVAPSVPFEFIRIRFGKTLDAIEVTE